MNILVLLELLGLDGKPVFIVLELLSVEFVNFFLTFVALEEFFSVVRNKVRLFFLYSLYFSSLCVYFLCWI